MVHQQQLTDAKPVASCESRPSSPIQRPARPRVEIGSAEDQEEAGHGEQAEAAELAEQDGPGVEEQRLDVEYQEEHADQGETDRPAVFGAGWFGDAALVG